MEKSLPKWKSSGPSSNNLPLIMHHTILFCMGDWLVITNSHSPQKCTSTHLHRSQCLRFHLVHEWKKIALQEIYFPLISSDWIFQSFFGLGTGKKHWKKLTSGTCSFGHICLQNSLGNHCFEIPYLCLYHKIPLDLVRHKSPKVVIWQ